MHLATFQLDREEYGLAVRLVQERDAEMLYHLAMGWMQSRLRDASTADAEDAQRLVSFAMHGLQRSGEHC